MLAEVQGVALFDLEFLLFRDLLLLMEVVEHGECLGRGHDRDIRIGVQERHDGAGVVAFHVLDDEVVGFAASKNGGEVREPFFRKVFIDRVHNGDLVVHDDIGVVCHAVRDDVLTFEQVDFMVVDANIFDVGRDSHSTIFHNACYLSICNKYTVYLNDTQPLMTLLTASSSCAFSGRTAAP